MSFSIRERDYIQAARAVGARSFRLMFRHILPNVSALIIVVAAFDVAGSDPGRIRAELPGRRRAAAHGDLGQHAHQLEAVHSERPLARRRARNHDFHHDSVHFSAG